MKAGSNVATLALLGITNERNHFLMASLTGGPGREPLSAGSLAVMPRFATGAGYRTLIYLLPEKIGSTESQGQIRFFSDTSGTSQALLFR